MLFYIAEQVFELDGNDGEVMTTRDFLFHGGGNNNTRRAQTAEWWSTAYGIQVVSSDNNKLVPIKEWLDTMGVKPTNRSAHNLATWKKLGLPGCSKYPLARRAPLTIWDVIGKTPLKPDAALREVHRPHVSSGG